MSKKAKKRKHEAVRLGLGDWYWYDICACMEPARTAAVHRTVGGRGEVGRLVDRDKARRK